MTICTHERKHFFGDIKDGEMVLNDIGKMARQCRLDIPNHFPHVKLDEFVVMPNHVHGILVVDGVDIGDGGVVGRDVAGYDIPHVGGRDVALQRLYDGGTHNWGTKKPPTKYFSKISPKKGILGTVIRSYKSACTYLIHKLNIGDLKRQSNYYDHIIIDEIALFRIREYIINNPQKWKRDRNNFQNLYM